MTTILVCMKEKVLVADKRTTTAYPDEVNLLRVLLGKDRTYSNGSKSYSDKSSKIFTIGDCVLAGSGDRSEIKRYIEEFRSNNCLREPISGGTNMIICRMKGKDLNVEVLKPRTIKGFFSKKLSWEREVITSQDSCISIGSGGKFAYSAYILGKTPEESVKFAAKHDLYTSYEQDRHYFNKEVDKEDY